MRNFVFIAALIFLSCANIAGCTSEPVAYVPVTERKPMNEEPKFCLEFNELIAAIATAKTQGDIDGYAKRVENWGIHWHSETEVGPEISSRLSPVLYDEIRRKNKLLRSPRGKPKAKDWVVRLKTHRTRLRHEIEALQSLNTDPGRLMVCIDVISSRMQVTINVIDEDQLNVKDLLSRGAIPSSENLELLLHSASELSEQASCMLNTCASLDP